MIIWLTGPSEAGKFTLVDALKEERWLPIKLENISDTQIRKGGEK